MVEVMVPEPVVGIMISCFLSFLAEVERQFPEKASLVVSYGSLS